MQKGLVSLLTPMYNARHNVHRLLDSVLRQTYPRIEMIVIDDGSTDNSSDIVSSYISRFQARGYTLRCVRQENSGQSVAIKNGLQMVHGEFLAWPDSDDFYAADEAIEKMVNVLAHSDEEFQMVRTQEAFVEEETLAPITIKGQHAHEEEDSSLFYDCLYAKNDYYYCPGAYMVRTEKLYEVTHFDIYTDKDAGQNLQLMLPILYKYRCKTILEPLYKVVVRKESHSRGQYKGFEAIKKRYASYLLTTVETLRRIGMPQDEIELHAQRISTGYNHRLFPVAIRERKVEEAYKLYEMLKEQRANGLSEDIVMFTARSMRLPLLAVLLMKIRKRIPLHYTLHI